MSEHTRTPWKVDKWLGSSDWAICYDAGSKGRGIAIAETTPGTGKELANARHIVRCVNSHDRLVEALREVTENLEHARFMVPDTEVSSMLFDSAREARALLKELEQTHDPL